MGTDWEDAFRRQEVDSVGRHSMDESFPPLLRMISAGTFPFLARDSPNAGSQSGANPSDLESGSSRALSPSRDNVQATTPPRRSGADGEVFMSEIALSSGVNPSVNVAGLERPSLFVSGKKDAAECQIRSNAGTPRADESRTPKSALAKRKSPGIPSTPKEFKPELSKKVSFGNEGPNAVTDNATQEVPQNPVVGTPKQRPKQKSYSQPMPSRPKHSDIMNGDHQHSGPVPRCRSQDADRMKEGNYIIFRTKSIKLERQLTSLQSRRQQEEEDQHVPPCHREASEGNAMPAGRYFDALKGPELEILKDSEEVLLPRDQQWPFLLRFPIGCFGICLGLGSQTMLWKTLATTSSMDLLHVPMTINLTLWCLALVALVTIFTTYSLKCLFYFEAVRREYYHPVRVNFFFAPWIACMFLTIGVPPAITTCVHPALWCLFMTPILILELKIYGQWLSGGERRLSKVANPSTHLSLVGNFVGSLLAAKVGWKEPAIFFWAVGAAHYLVLFVTLYQRLPTAAVLPKELHPVFFLFVAAPSAASVAWENIVGDFDHVSRISYFVALFLYASLVVRLKFFCGFQFTVAWWAYTFPMSASAIATVRYSHEVRHPVIQVLAILLSLISAITVFSLFLSTILHGVFWNTLFPNDMAIAITTRRHKGKGKRKKIHDNDSSSETSRDSSGNRIPFKKDPPSIEDTITSECLAYSEIQSFDNKGK